MQCIKNKENFYRVLHDIAKSISRVWREPLLFLLLLTLVLVHSVKKFLLIFIIWSIFIFIFYAIVNYFKKQKNKIKETIVN